MDSDLTILTDEDITNKNILKFFKSEKDYERFKHYSNLFSKDDHRRSGVRVKLTNSEIEFWINEIKERGLNIEKEPYFIGSVLSKSEWNNECEHWCDELIELGSPVPYNSLFNIYNISKEKLDYLLKYVDINSTNYADQDFIMYAFYDCRLTYQFSTYLEECILNENYKINKVDKYGFTLLDHVIKYTEGGRIERRAAYRREKYASIIEVIKPIIPKIIERGGLKGSEIPVGSKTKGAKNN